MNDTHPRCSGLINNNSCPCTGFLPDPKHSGLCFCDHEEDDHQWNGLPKRHCANGQNFRPTTLSIPADGRTPCTHCNLPYFAHSDINTFSPTPIPTTSLASYQATQPALATAGPVNPTPWIRLGSNIDSSNQTTNNRRMQAAQQHRSLLAPSNVAHPPFNSFPTINVSFPAVTTSEVLAKRNTRGRASTVIRNYKQHERSTAYQYKVIIHPEPPYGTVLTPSGTLFQEMRVPIMSKIDAFVRQCESLSLAFDWNVSGNSSDIVYGQLHAALVDHFATTGLVFAIPGPGLPDNQTLAWTMYMCSQSARVDYLGPLLRIVTQISTEMVTHTHLQTWARRYAALSGPNSGRKLIFIGPRLHMVAGRYFGQPRHHCLAVRMWDRFFSPNVTEESIDPMCYESCPLPSTQIPEPSQTIVGGPASLASRNAHILSPLSALSHRSLSASPDLPESILSENTRSVPAMVGPSGQQPRHTPVAGPSTLFTPVSARVDNSTQPVAGPSTLFTPVSARVDNSNANRRALTAWYRLLRNRLVINLRPDEPRLTIVASDPATAALGLFNHIFALCTDAKPVDLADVRIQNCTWRTLMASDQFFHIGSGVGTGPQTSTYVALAKLVSSDQHHWTTDDEGFSVPLIMSFSPSNEDLALFHAHGIVLRLLLIWKQGIFPFSPVLLMYLVEGFEAATDLRFLQLVAPRIADRLATWPPPLQQSASGEHQPAFVIGKDPMNLVIQVLPNVQPHNLRRLPATAMAELTPQLQSGLVFGSQEPRVNPQHGILSALRRGFDSVPDLENDSVDVPTSFIKTFHPHSFDIITALCAGRKLVSPQQVIDLIQWHTVREQDISNATLDENLDYDQLENLWIVAFARYLQGTGHPTSDTFSIGTGKQRCDGSVNETVYRSRLFLEAVTASPYLPSDDNKSIQVNFVSTFQESYPWGTNLNANLCIHSCTKEVNVLIDANMAEILEQDSPDDASVATPFDCWIHSQLYDPKAAALGYNTI